MRSLFTFLLLFGSNAFGQVGSTASTCIWSGTVADCLPSAGINLANQRAVRFGEATANGSNYVAIQGPASTSDLTLTLPSAVAADEVLVSDDGTGTLDFQKIVNANVDAAAAIDGSKLNPAISVGDQETVNGETCVTLCISCTGNATMNYTRVGSVVFFGLILTIDSNGSPVDTQCRFTPPAGSPNFTATSEVTGTCVINAATGTPAQGFMEADATNDAILTTIYDTPSDSSRSYSCVGQYNIP